MRKFAAFILTTVTILSLVIIPTNARYFSDVNIGHWARESINYATDNGFIDPVSTYTFNPDGNFTRADVAKMIYRFEGSPAIATTTQFTDVSSTASYAKAVSWMASKGIMGGTSNTTFEPNTGIKRQDLAVVFFRYGNYLKTKQNGYIKNSVMEKQADITGFSDYSSITGYALEAVSWAVATKLITGEQGGIIAPKKIVVRETGAELLKRFGIYVEGINFDRDVYGFTNSPTIFINKYSVLKKHKDILFYYLNLHDEADEVVIDPKTLARTTRIQYIKDTIDGDAWSGSCCGMSTTVILSKMGKLDLIGNLGEEKENIKQFIQYDSNLISAINYYQVSQNVLSLKNVTVSIKKSSSLDDWRDTINNFPLIIDENGMVLLGITYLKSDGSTGNHSLILYDYEQTTTGYNLYVYDPNSLHKKTLYVRYVTEEDSSGVNVYTAKLTYNDQEIINVRYKTEIDSINHAYNRYDLDSYYNDFDAGNSMSSSATQWDSTFSVTERASRDTIYLVLTLDNEFEVHNKEGQVLSYTLGNFGGDMTIYSENPIFTGSNGVTQCFVEVNNSESFTYIPK